jgi:hypothetical protein
LVNIDEKLVEIDNKVIEKVGFKPDISSACRCVEHNKNVGGSENSSHLCDKEKKCLAIDYSIPSSWQRAVITIALVELGVKRIGFGDTFLHWDVDFSKAYPVFWLY